MRMAEEGESEETRANVTLVFWDEARKSALFWRRTRVWSKRRARRVTRLEEDMAIIVLQCMIPASVEYSSSSAYDRS